MKKTGLLIKDLPAPIRELADKYADKWEKWKKELMPLGSKDNPYKDLKFEDADLQIGFNWSDTKEGRNFWVDYYSRYKHISGKVSDNLHYEYANPNTSLASLKVDDVYICGYDYEPTANCQVGALSGVSHSLVTKYKDKLLFEHLIKEWKTPHLKNAVLMDINNEYTEVAESILEKYNIPIIFKQPYDSTNGSEMTMYLLKMN